MFGKLFGKRESGKGAEKKALSLGVDPGMNYCPVCGDEYRADSVKCVGCDVQLISGAEKLAQILKREQLLANRSMEISADDKLVTLRKGPLKDVKQLQKLLAEMRIPAILAGDEQSCGKGCCGGEMYLQVREDDAESAVAVLARDFAKSTALENHDLTHTGAVYVQGAESTICPACGCEFVPGEGSDCPECGLCFS